ncbi:MAG: UDP-N-acetylmuramoyl-L-alanine--D-glutamate ligase [Mariprofundaceae bacterium]|nr:UDP-N-acetylmuramoyl-L-alanine--D-glutamate ligase [Mariprofundaceae bacterium]
MDHLVAAGIARLVHVEAAVNTLKLADTAIIGIGRSGLSMAHYLMRQGESFDVYDEAPFDVATLGIMANHAQSGALPARMLCQYKRLLLSPGIPWQHPALCAARKAGVVLCGDLELFAADCACPLFAITGTNGKTTVTQLLTELLNYLPGDCISAGNIGTPMLDVFIKEDLSGNNDLPARVVLELSSFQLERSNHIRPQWAALLNIQPDHADMHDSAEAYLDAKLRLFATQKSGDTAMFPLDSRWDALCQELYQRGVHVHRFGLAKAGDLIAETLSAGILQRGKSHRLFWHQLGSMEQLNCRHLSVLGVHQHINLAVAAQGAADAGVPALVIRDALIRFRGLAHRLQDVGETLGKTWFDDSKATNPTAAMAALQSFEQVVWICGGLRKGLDLSPLIPVVRQHVFFAVVIGMDPSPYIEMLDAAGVPYAVAETMELAVDMAAKKGGAKAVLLSPAAASQDQFANYAERGCAFVNAMAGLSTSMPRHEKQT